MRKITGHIIAFLGLWLISSVVVMFAIIASAAFIKLELPAWSSVDWQDFRISAFLAFLYLCHSSRTW